MSSTFTVPGKAVVTVSQYALRQLPYNALSEVTVTPLTDVRMTVTN